MNHYVAIFLTFLHSNIVGYTLLSACVSPVVFCHHCNTAMRGVHTFKPPSFLIVVCELLQKPASSHYKSSQCCNSN